MENPGHFYEGNFFRYFKAVILGSGLVFGDLGILTKKPRSATIVATEDTYFGYLAAVDYQNILMQTEKLKQQKQAKFFQESFLENFSNEKLLKICINFYKRKFRCAEKIFCEGQECKEVFLVKKGVVELFKSIQVKYGTGPQRIQTRCAVLTAREFLGEFDAMRQHQRTRMQQ